MSTLLNLDSYRHELFEQQQQQQQQLSSSPTYSVLSMESSSSSPSTVSASQDCQAKYYSSNSPSSASNMSPKSTTSETSSINMQNLNISASYPYYDDGSSSQMQTYHFTTGHGNASEHPQIELSVPHLVILEQPVDKFRFRYQSEMHGTHGSLMGVHTEKSKKTFPSVELRGFQGEAKIRCSLFQVDPSKRAAHSHHLVIKSGEIDLIDPHDIEVNAETGYVAMFQGMGIIHTAKKNIAEELCKKIKRQRAVEMNREISLREEHQLQKEAAEMAKTMNLNQVCLCFQAFQVDPVSGMWQQLCEPVYSNAINNMKSALTGELKICRLSSTAGNVEGGEEVFMFVEKVCKNNIKIRFYELDEFDQEIWQDWGTFSEADVHHQYAIAFKTPPYRNKDITEPAEVMMQLFRPRDKCQSEPVPFKYKPRPGMLAAASSSRKRQRVHSGNISSEIPTTVPNDGGLAAMVAATAGPSRLPPLHQPFPMVVSQSTISKEFNKSGIIQEILESNVPGPSGATTGDITFSSGDFRDFIQCSSEDLHKLINEIGEATEQSKLETDAVASGSGADSHSHCEAIRLERALESYLEANAHDKDVEILRKILAIIKLFGRDYERCRELISALWMSSNKHKANCLHMAIERREAAVSCKLIALLQEFQLHDLLGLVNDRTETAIHLAVSSHQVDVVESLLLAGVRISCCDYKGNTALHCAVLENGVDVLEALVGHCKRNGLRLDTANDDGYSPLQLAVMCRNLRITKLLLERGASAKGRDLKHGNNILHIAVESDSLDLVNYILEHVDKSLSDEPNNAGYTPLQLANARHQVNANNKLIVRELLRFNPEGRLEKEPSIEDDEDEEEAMTREEQPPVEAGSSDSVLLSMNLTCNRVEVIQMLENHNLPSREARVVELTPLKTVPYEGGSSQLFDETCLKELCKMLNKNDLWKDLGSLLDFNAFFTIWEQSPNPTEMLLNYFEMQKMKLEHLTDILQAMDLKEAIHCIDEMVCRNIK